MAERRMISKSISVSEKVNSLSLFGRLLYTWMIPHADDFGRLPGSPMKVRALVVPMADETVKDVEAALHDMHDKGLIIWYEVGGEKFIQIKNFEKHQQGLHKRTKSKFPEPPNTKTENHGNEQNIPGNSGKFPLEENRTEENRREITAAANNAHAREDDDQTEKSSYEPFAAAYRRVCQRDLTPFQAEQLGAYIDQDGFEEAVVVRAIERAALRGGGFNLILHILNDYAAGGAKTLDGAIAYDEEFEARKKRENARQANKSPPSYEERLLEARRREIALNRWIDAGGDPNEFVYEPSGGH